MNQRIASAKTQQASKKTVLFLLYCFAGAITAMGIGYTIYSFMNHVDLLVKNNAVPGTIFGIIITFLCAYLSINKYLRMKASSLYYK